MREIALRNARAKLAAVVDDAIEGRPAVITRHGKKQAVLLSYKEWQRLLQVPSFGRLLMSMPMKAGDLPRRNRARLRTRLDRSRKRALRTSD